MSVTRVILFTLAGLVAFLICTGLALGLLLESRWALNYLENRATAAAGRPVALGGLDIDWGLTPRLTLSDVVIENPDWAQYPHLARVRRAAASVSLPALLRGQWTVPDLLLDQPELHLERAEDGSVSWGQGSAQSAADESAGSPIPVPRIQSLRVRRGQLSYRDAVVDGALDLDYRAHLGAVDGPVEVALSGSGHFRDDPVALALKGGEALRGVQDSARFPVELTATWGDQRLVLSGELDEPLDPGEMAFKLSAAGPELAPWGQLLAAELPESVAYELSVELGYGRGTWSGTALRAVVGDSDLQGNVEADIGESPPALSASLFSERLDFAQLRPDSQEDPEPPSELAATAVEFVAALDATLDVHYEAHTIDATGPTIEGFDAGVTLSNDSRLAIEAAATVGGLPVEASFGLAAQRRPVPVSVQLEIEPGAGAKLSVPGAAHGGADSTAAAVQWLPSGNLEGEAALELLLSRTRTGADAAAMRMILEKVSVERFDLRYTGAEGETSLTTGVIDTDDRFGFEVSGRLEGIPLEARVQSSGLGELVAAAGNEPVPVALTAELGQTELSAQGTVSVGWPPQRVDLSAEAAAQSLAATAELFGVDAPAREAKVKADLAYSQDRWQLTDMVAEVGDSDIAGSAIVAPGPARRIDVAWASRRLDLPGLLELENTDADGGRATDAEPVTLESLEAVAAWSGEFEWRIDELVVPGATLPGVEIEARLADGQLRVNPLRLTAGGGRVAASLRLDLDAPGFAGALSAQAHNVDLAEFSSGTTSPAEGHPLQTGAGFTPGSVGGSLDLRLPPVSSEGEPATLPGVLDRLRLEGLRLVYDDPRLGARSNIRVVATGFHSPAHIEGKIEYRGRAVSVDLATGTLNQVFSDWRALPVDLDIQFEDTRVQVDTRAGQLFPVERLSAAVAVEGPTPAEVGSLFELPLPDMLPYRVEAELQRAQSGTGNDTWEFSDLEGRVGDSDIDGKLVLTTGGERPTLFADLHSDKLDFDDLGPALGVPPDPTETAAASQKADAEAFAQRSQVFPTEQLDLSQLALTDARVAYRAGRVQAPGLPLDDVAVELVLENGHLLTRRVDFGVAGGTAAFDLELKARSKPWTGKLAGQFDRVGLDRIFRGTEAADDTLGNIGGRVTLWVQGNSVAEWLGSADGGSYLTITDGEIDALLLELAGLDFIESLSLLLGTESSTDIDCAYADLQARDGTVAVRPLLIDTADTKIRGEGTIDLKRERLDLTLRPYPQDFSMLTSRGPLRVGGTFKDPAFSVQPSIPGPDAGTATDSARCDGLVEALRRERKKNARL